MSFQETPPSGITRQELEPLVLAGLTVRRIAERLGSTSSAVRRAIRFHRLPQPIDIRRRMLKAAIDAGSSFVIRTCSRHGETEFAIVGSEQRARCKKCRSEAVARRRRKVKEILAKEAGGRCLICGFDSSLTALEFHHLDPAMKSFGLAQRGITRSLATVRAEAAKCVLLCANCHARVEAREIEVPIESSQAIASPM